MAARPDSDDDLQPTADLTDPHAASHLALEEEAQQRRPARDRPSFGIFTEDAVQDPSGSRTRRTMVPLKMRLTRPGLWLLGVLALLLLMAMNYRNNANYLLFSVMAGCFLVSAMEARRNLKGIVVLPGVPLPVFAGERGCLPLRIRVKDGRPRTLLRVGLSIGKRRVAAVANHARDGEAIDLQLPSLPRGVHKAFTCSISSTHPFGLVEVVRELPVSVEQLVYPAALGDLPLPGDAEDGGSTDRTADFAGHRSYQPGDAPQHIDWKVLARSEVTVVKQFGSRADTRRHRLGLDNLMHLDLESALSQISRWVCQAEELRECYAIDLDSANTPAACGPAHRQTCLEALARHGG
ncbi:MAG: DUF58 domain-containing protein [Planctomycetota bacterium]